MRHVDLKGNLGSEDTTRAPSQSIWGDCPWTPIAEGAVSGTIFFDDFVNQPTFVAGTGSTLKYAYYGDTGVTFTSLKLVGGVLEIAGNDADNDEGILQQYGAPWVVSDTAGEDFKLWFECRFKKASIGDDSLAMFVGLAQDGQTAVEAMVDDTGVLRTTAAWLGFQVLADNGEELDFVYQENAQTINELIAPVDSLEADTYVKAGFLYDPQEETARRIKAFINGIEQTTYVTGTQIAAATFPDQTELAFTITTKVMSNTAEVKSQFDWVRIAQLSN